MNPTSVISFISLILTIFVCGNEPLSYCSQSETDTLFVLFQQVDDNKIIKSSRIHPGNREYPKDWGRSYHISYTDFHIWFYYFNTLPENSDLVFEFNEIDKNFIEIHDFKDQEWFRRTAKEEIYELYLANDKVIFLVEKDRIADGKAIMIRVYADKQTVE